MIQVLRRSASSRVALLAVAVGLAPGCTALDDYLPGTPFTPDQPTAEVTVVGAVNADRVEQNTDSCSEGTTIFWGTARNTGDLDLNDVFIVIDAFGPSGVLLGSFRTDVFGGDVVEIAGPAPVDTLSPEVATLDIASTALLIDESGTFSVCAPLPYGSVARTEYRTGFTAVEEGENE